MRNGFPEVLVSFLFAAWLGIAVSFGARQVRKFFAPPQMIVLDAPSPVVPLPEQWILDEAFGREVPPWTAISDLRRSPEFILPVNGKIVFKHNVFKSWAAVSTK